MRILFFGIFERPYDTEVYIANTLESLGHEVIRKNRTLTTDKMLAELLKGEYDFILLSKGWFCGDQQVVDKLLKDCKTLKVGWFFDLVIGTRREERMLKHQSFKADIVCTTDGGQDERWKELGINHKTLRQGIYEPEAYMVDTQIENDIVFVGGSEHDYWFHWTHRADLLRWLKGTYGTRFKWLGQHDGIRNDELNRLYASTKIVVGDSVYAPNYWSNRLYETIGRGGFLIFPMVEGLEKEFIPYKHFIPYTPYDWDGLKEKIDYYLTHDKEREEIRKAGFEHCKKYHTYTKRCEELIEIVNEHKRA